MTYHKGTVDKPGSRLTCDRTVTYEKRPGGKSYEHDPVKCASVVTGRPTAASLRRLAREQGWQKHTIHGDLCPQHRAPRATNPTPYGRRRS